MKKHGIKLITFLASLAAAANLQAATVTYTLEVNPGMNTFELFATSSAGDNFGMVSFGVPLIGSFSAIQSVSPNGLAGATSTTIGAKVGFSELRLPIDGSSGTNPTISGSQDNLVPTPYLVRGFGQNAGDLINETGVNDFFTVEQQSHAAKLLLATGSFTGANPSIDTVSTSLGSNTFDAATGIASTAATINSSVVLVPEPTTGLLLSLSGVMLFLRRRRKG